MKTIKIGRNPDNDIIIDSKTQTVSRYHAVLKVYDDGTVIICDNSTNGTFINDVKAEKGIDIIIRKGDKIRLGPMELLDWSKVKILDIPIASTVIGNSETESYTIGTENDNQIIISDPSRHVSRHHAIIKLKADGMYYIFDKSTNGTYVNGVKIKRNVDFPVSTSDTISLGNHYQLNWNKVPNAPVVKPSPIGPGADSGSSAKSDFDFTKIISWGIGIVIIAVFFYFKYYEDDVPKHSPNSEIEQIEPKSGESNISSLYEKNKAAVFMIITSNGASNIQGSGFFISSSGVAVSNFHVFKGTYKGFEEIKTLNGTFKIERVLSQNEDMDYIIFKVAGHGQSFPFLKIANGLPRVGENVFAIGNPKGLEHTLSTGIVSSLRENNALIQTTTEITHGSSGGPLFNMRGEVIGITTAGLGEANLNFAVNVIGMGLGNY